MKNVDNSGRPQSIENIVYFSEVMSNPVTAFEVNERVGTIIEKLKSEPFDGFPIVEYSHQVRHLVALLCLRVGRLRSWQSEGIYQKRTGCNKSVGRLRSWRSEGINQKRTGCNRSVTA